MDFSKQIKPEMKVVGSDNTEVALVDHLEGSASIKLKKDSKGEHHYIPVSWISSVDDRIHLDRPFAKATSEWKTTV